MAEEEIINSSDEGLSSFGDTEEQATPRRSFGRSVAKVKRTVRLLNTDVYDGRYLVFDTESLATYLVPTDDLAFTSKDQQVDESVLDRCDSPYQWDDEIDSLVVTKNQIRLAILRAGHIQKKPLNFKEMVAALLKRGEFPLVKEK